MGEEAKKPWWRLNGNEDGVGYGGEGEREGGEACNGSRGLYSVQHA